MKAEGGPIAAKAGPIGTVVLAAGGSTRLGQPKQLLAYRGKTLLRHAVETALSLPDTPVVVVLGAQAEQIRPELDGLRVAIVENPDWQRGMGSSLRTGLNALLTTHPETAAVLFLLCDQPLLSAKTLSTLLATYQQTGHLLIASAYGPVLGVPALFHRSLFSELLSLEGAHGAQQIIQRYRDRALGISFPEGAVDIDTPDDYASLRLS